MEVESRAFQRGYSKLEQIEHSNCLLVLCVIVGFICFAIDLAVGMASNWLMSGFALYAFILCGLGGLICGAVVGWQWHLALLERKQRLQETTLADQDIAIKQRFIRAADKAETNGDNYKMVISDKSATIEVVRRATQLDQVRIQQAARSAIHQVDRPAQPPALPSPASVIEEEKPIPIPVAPSFWDIINLITEGRMPLCFVVDVNPRSRTYGKTVPVFGTILDLLSLCIIGKPGKGKSVLLLFYICCLAKHGAEMHILDPQGAFKELQLLHGKRLPAMPPTARIYYYSSLEEMEAVVSNVLAEIKDREKLFQPHLENGELRLHMVKHPLVILADELPIIADMDLENRAKTKEENKARKEEGLDQLQIRQVTNMVKTAVLAARKYMVYFVGASQSIDASILPTRITAGFNSRIIFSSSEQKARMAGLESDVAKRLLPVIRRAGPGKVIYDCGRWDTPLVAAFPNITIEDVLQFFGVSMDELKALWVAELTAQEQQRSQQTRNTGPLGVAPTIVQSNPTIVQSKRVVRRATLADAIEVWNESPVEIGRPRLRDELQARGLECSDDLAKNLLKAIKQQLESTGGAGGE
jgi:hypothetical protein